MKPKVSALEWGAWIIVVLWYIALTLPVTRLVWGLLGGSLAMFFVAFIISSVFLLSPLFALRLPELRQWRDSDEPSVYPKERPVGMYAFYYIYGRRPPSRELPVQDYRRVWTFSLVWLVVWTVIVVIGFTLFEPK